MDRDKPPKAEIPASPPADEERKKALESYLPDFLMEYADQIDTLENCVMALEHNPSDQEAMKNCFRQVHTLKGSANALGFLALGFLCHIMESALAFYRSKNTPLPSGLVELLYEFNDSLRRIKNQISSSLTDSGVDIRWLVGKIEAAAHPARETAATVENQASKDDADSGQLNTDHTSLVGQAASIQSVSERIGAIRVDVNRLDSLMNSLVELALLRNRTQQLVHNMVMGERTESLIEGFSDLATNLDSATRRLQASVMRARMLPVGNVFNKFGRVVRDLGVALGKEADLVIHGAETELDKSLIENISDPLLHIIRNCIDHGVEPPAERDRLGKPRRGVISLNAFHEGNSIVVEIFDDGKGINPQALADKAVESGAISPERARDMSKTQKLSLMFMPGISTARSVTNVSGRGVGMDVVKTNLEKLNGAIDIDSEPGAGTRITLKIPLTLAIIPTLLCRVGIGVFGIPLFSVQETTRIKPTDLQMTDGEPSVDIRGERVPVVILSRTLDFPENGGRAPDDIDVVVIKTGLRRIGLAVGKTLGQEEVLIKTLDSFRGIFDPPYLSGATILGDGSIAFILDISKLAETVKTSQTPLSPASAHLAQAEPEELALIFGDDEARRYAVAARWIGGVTSMDTAQISHRDGLEIVESDYGELPVTRIASVTGAPARQINNQCYLVVFRSQGREAGLLVNEVSGLRNIKSTQLKAAAMGDENVGPLVIDNRPTNI
ncbi:MAG: chemotaxis protein CheA, partial [Nitrospinota bacterium]|nr:chemotaxis protein CheA [Nitrospinota bacterium]